MWNRIEELESAIEDRPKMAQAGREIAKFFFLKSYRLNSKDKCAVTQINI